MPNLISKSEYDTWLMDRTTKKIKQRIDQLIQEIKDDWADDKYINEEERQRGRIQGLSEAYNIDYHEIEDLEYEHFKG